MKNVVKLFTIALVFGFLVGCGSGGGSSDSGDDGDIDLSFSDLNAVFTPFSTSGLSANVVYIEKDKVYKVTKSAFNTFNASVLMPGGYVLDDGWYERFDAASDIEYFARSNSTAGTLQVGIDSYSNFAGLTDNAFDDEFDTIDGSLKEIFIYIDYDANISSKYAKYATSILPGAGFNCNKNATTNNKWLCSRDRVGDKFIYGWIEESDHSYDYVAIPK